MAKRKIKTKVRKTSPPKPKRSLYRRLKPTEFLVYRDRKGRRRKSNARVKLVAEVWSKTTGRSTNKTFNKVKKGKPIPQTFAPRQRGIMETKVSTRTKSRKKGQTTKEISFILHSSESITEQIERLDNLYTAAMDAVRLLGPVTMTMYIDANGQRYTTRGVHIETDRWNRKDFVVSTVHSILEGIDTMAIRFSPKKHAKRKRNKKITRTMHISVVFDIAGG